MSTDFIDGETKIGIFHLTTPSIYDDDSHRYDNKVYCDDGTRVWVCDYAGKEGERVTVKYSKDRNWWDVIGPVAK
jgi:hypothetical protein